MIFLCVFIVPVDLKWNSYEFNLRIANENKTVKECFCSLVFDYLMLLPFASDQIRSTSTLKCVKPYPSMDISIWMEINL